MDIKVLTIVLLVGLFLSLVVFLEIGRWLGAPRIAKEPEMAQRGLNTVEASVFGLLGLLIAFTFNGAETRFETRQQLIVQESNAIGTAYDLLDLLPTDKQPAIRDHFRRYVDSRIAYYRIGIYHASAQEELRNSVRLQREIWQRSVAACQSVPRPAPCMLLLPALNEMIDITSTRKMAALIHPPILIYALLISVGMICAFLVGFDMPTRKQNWVHILGFVAIIAITIYVIMDLEFPRVGIIRLDTADAFIAEARQNMR